MRSLLGTWLRLHHLCARLGDAARLSLVAFVAACSALSQSVVSVDGANAEWTDLVARIAVDTERPVLIRAVDEKNISSVQLSSRLRSFTYALHPGRHVLWVSSAPYGLPLVPQRLKCYIINATLTAGALYLLRFDATRQTPVLSQPAGSESEATGILVDEPFIHERSCRWR